MVCSHRVAVVFPRAKNLIGCANKSAHGNDRTKTLQSGIASYVQRSKSLKNHPYETLIAHKGWPNQIPKSANFPTICGHCKGIRSVHIYSFEYYSVSLIGISIGNGVQFMENIRTTG